MSVEHGDTPALQDVHLRLPAAGITVVAGASGAGKSTLLRLCNRLEVPTRGRVWFRGRDVAALDPQWLRRRVGMVFQQPALFGGTVRDNLAVAAPEGDATQHATALQSAALDPGLLDRDADTLSGGEAQRVCLARTLVTDPEVLLLDEPTASLDARAQRLFEDTAKRLAAGGMPIVWVTHELAQLRRLADWLVALRGGRLVYTGDPGAGAATSALDGVLREGDE